MPFLRFSRDKRGYEHTYLVHEQGGRGRPARARVLYWFRTPPGVRVGRDPFDEEARRRIESHNPGLSFDWKAIVSTPIPPIPEVEHWRERRRVERAAKVARRDEEKETEAQIEPAVEAIAIPEPLEPPDPAESLPGAGEKTFTVVQASEEQPRKRRRRRGGRRRAAGHPAADGAAETSGLDPALQLDAVRAEPADEAADRPDSAAETGLAPQPSDSPSRPSEE